MISVLKKTISIILLILIIYLLPVAAFTTQVNGQTGQEFEPGELPSAASSGLRDDNLLDFVSDIIRVALGLLGILLLVMIIYGGLLYATAAGDEEKVTRARNTLIYAIVGIIVISAAWILSDFLISNILLTP